MSGLILTFVPLQGSESPPPPVLSPLATDVAGTLDGLLTTWSSDIGSNGLWGASKGLLPDNWAFAAGPAGACALLDQVTGGSKWQARAAATVEGVLAGFRQPDGSFGPPSPDNSIDTMEFGKALAVCLLVYGDRIDKLSRSRWVAAMLGGAEYLHARGNLAYYTNGNINAGNFVFLRLAFKATGDAKVGYYAEKAWFTLHDPAASVGAEWAGYGYVSTSTDQAPYDGAAATSYFTEEGAGGSGFDWNYTAYAATELSLLQVLAPEPRVARLINMTLNSIWPRVDQVNWRLETAGGTRMGVGAQSRLIGFTTPGMAVAAMLLGRANLGSVSSQFYDGDGFKHFYGVEAPTNGAPGYYRGAFGELGVFLKAVAGG